MCWETKKLMSAVPSLFGTRDRFHGRQFFPGSGIGRVGGVGGGWFGDDPRTSLVAQMVKHQPAVQETWVGNVPWRMEGQPTPVFLPGESRGQRSVAGYGPWGRTESHMTERLYFTFKHITVPPQIIRHSVQFSSVAQSCPTLCDPMDCSTPGLPVHHQLPEFTQTHVC